MAERIRLKFSLKTTSPMHIGSGLEHPREINGPDKVTTVLVKGIMRDGQNPEKPYIPGSTLKGCFRGMARQAVKRGTLTQQQLWDIFGVEKDKSEDNPRPGAFHFSDAFLTNPQYTPRLFAVEEGSRPPLDWSQDDFTYIMRHVAIDSASGVGIENRLFHSEVVPSGAEFSIIIDAFAASEQQLGAMTSLIESLSEDRRINIGGGTSNDFGRVALIDKSLTIYGLSTNEDCKTFIQSFDTLPDTAFQEILPPLNQKAISAIRSHHINGLLGQNELQIRVSLSFIDPFLCNDPSQCRKAQDDENGVPHTYLKNESGVPILPASGFRGKFRNQAEKILRTLRNNATAACFPGTQNACEPFFPQKSKNLPEQVASTLCLACQLFGAPGWSSPVQSTEFIPADSPHMDYSQNMEATDRFTAGVAGSRLFGVTAVDNLTLEGTLFIDLHRIRPVHLGLLVHVLRDLIEGDCSFGYGTKKGFGNCTASIQLSLPEDEVLDSWLKSFDDAPTRPDDITLDAIDKTNRSYLNWFLESFKKEITNG